MSDRDPFGRDDHLGDPADPGPSDDPGSPNEGTFGQADDDYLCECGHRRREHKVIDYGLSTRGVECVVCGCAILVQAGMQPAVIEDVELQLAQAEIDVIAATMIAVTVYGDVIRSLPRDKMIEPIIRGARLHPPDDQHPWPRIEVRHPTTRTGKAVWIEFTTGDETEEPF